MSVNINADTTNGLVLTSDTSGEIKLQAGGADIATVSSTGIAMASGKTLPASALTGTVPSSSVDALSTASGSAPSYSARAWVNFQGTGTVTIRASGNVSSITDLGVGYYTVNFITAMPDINYCVVGSCNFNNAAGMTDFATAIQSVTNATNVICHDVANTTKYDPYAMNVAVFR